MICILQETERCGKLSKLRQDLIILIVLVYVVKDLVKNIRLLVMDVVVTVPYYKPAGQTPCACEQLVLFCLCAVVSGVHGRCAVV